MGRQAPVRGAMVGVARDRDNGDELILPSGDRLSDDSPSDNSDSDDLGYQSPMPAPLRLNRKSTSDDSGT